MAPALEFKDISLAIGGSQILDHVSLSVQTGMVTGLVGQSGSGKSMAALTAMRLAPGSAHITGQVFLNGADTLKNSEKQMCAIRGRDIAMVFQEPMTALNPLHAIGAQVAETILTHSTLPRNEAAMRAGDLLRDVGLDPAIISPHRYPHELSGGQRQRVVIAIAIAMNPAVLIADEPTTALDVTTQAEILTLLRNLVKDKFIALLLITHDLAVISDMADNIAVMKDGRIVEKHAPAGFFASGLSSAANGLVARPLQRSARKMPSEGKLSQTILHAENITCAYRMARETMFSPVKLFRPVNGASLSLRAGENIGLVGESGCGKSTLARALLGLQPIVSGKIEIDGEAFPSRDQSAMRRMRRKIQIVFQDPYSSFNPRQKISKIIGEPFHLLGAPLGNAEKYERIASALSAVGLAPGDADKFPHEFSGGQRQRIAIARSLITQPAVIILDEATSALDVTSRNQILELLMKLSEDRGVSYLFITHDLTVIREVADRVLVMKAGEIIEENTTGEIFQNPQTGYTKKLIDAAPQIKWARAASA